MPFGRLCVSVVAGAVLSSPLYAAPDLCAPMASLIHQAETDFPSLGHKRLSVGGCAMRRNEFTCGWRFPGDGYGFAEEQSDRLVQCMCKQPEFKFLGVKKHETGFILEPDLTVFVGQPELDSDGWTVWLRMVSTAPPN